MSEGSIGNGFDDFIGFDATRRMAIMYNGDELDEGVNHYGLNPPQMGTILLSAPGDKLNHTESAGAFTFFNNGSGRDGSPRNGTEYFNYLIGRWRDGTPFKDDCDPLNGIGPETPYVFRGDPLKDTLSSEPLCK